MNGVVACVKCEKYDLRNRLRIMHSDSESNKWRCIPKTPTYDMIIKPPPSPTRLIVQFEPDLETPAQLESEEEWLTQPKSRRKWPKRFKTHRYCPMLSKSGREWPPSSKSRQEWPSNSGTSTVPTSEPSLIQTLLNVVSIEYARSNSVGDISTNSNAENLEIVNSLMSLQSANQDYRASTNQELTNSIPIQDSANMVCDDSQTEENYEVCDEQSSNQISSTDAAEMLLQMQQSAFYINMNGQINVANESPQIDVAIECPQIDIGNESAQIDIENESAQIDIGNESSQIDIGNESAQIDIENESPQIDIGNECPQIDIGNESPQIDIGNESAQIDIGNESAQIDIGNESAQINIGNESSQIDVANEPAQIDESVNANDQSEHLLNFEECYPYEDDDGTLLYEEEIDSSPSSDNIVDTDIVNNENINASEYVVDTSFQQNLDSYPTGSVILQENSDLSMNDCDVMNSSLQVNLVPYSIQQKQDESDNSLVNMPDTVCHMDHEPISPEIESSSTPVLWELETSVNSKSLSNTNTANDLECMVNPKLKDYPNSFRAESLQYAVEESPVDYAIEPIDLASAESPVDNAIEPVVHVSEESQVDNVIEPIVHVSEESPVDIVIEPIVHVSEESPVDIVTKPIDLVSEESPVDNVIEPIDLVSEESPVDIVTKPIDLVSEESPVDNVIEPVVHVSEESQVDNVIEPIVHVSEESLVDIVTKPIDLVSEESPVDIVTKPIDLVLEESPVDNVIEPIDLVSEESPVDIVTEPIDLVSEESPVDIVTEPIDLVSEEYPVDIVTEPIDLVSEESPMDIVTEPIDLVSEESPVDIVTEPIDLVSEESPMDIVTEPIDLVSEESPVDIVTEPIDLVSEESPVDIVIERIVHVSEESPVDNTIEPSENAIEPSVSITINSPNPIEQQIEYFDHDSENDSKDFLNNNTIIKDGTSPLKNSAVPEELHHRRLSNENGDVNPLLNASNEDENELSYIKVEENDAVSTPSPSEVDQCYDNNDYSSVVKTELEDLYNDDVFNPQLLDSPLTDEALMDNQSVTPFIGYGPESFMETCSACSQNCGDMRIHNHAHHECPMETPIIRRHVCPDPTHQFRIMRLNVSFNLPDPMIIPKSCLDKIIKSPYDNINYMYATHPELRILENCERLMNYNKNYFVLSNNFIEFLICEQVTVSTFSVESLLSAAEQTSTDIDLNADLLIALTSKYFPQFHHDLLQLLKWHEESLSPGQRPFNMETSEYQKYVHYLKTTRPTDPSSSKFGRYGLEKRPPMSPRATSTRLPSPQPSTSQSASMNFGPQISSQLQQQDIEDIGALEHFQIKIEESYERMETDDNESPQREEPPQYIIINDNEIQIKPEDIDEDMIELD